ncbi:hypothetical protein ACHAWX_006063, partial [Stephanocyclus meneghinianus]
TERKSLLVSIIFHNGVVVLIHPPLLLDRQDILFGRGGLTNRHFGNKKYRDVINEHRKEYVEAKKVDKPRVAKRVVKKILSDGFASSSVRFLKRDDNGYWVEVDEHEAVCKVSQALREKSRWSCMKADDENASVVKLQLEPAVVDKKKRSQRNEEAGPADAFRKVETAKPSDEMKVKKIRREAPAQHISVNTRTESKSLGLMESLPTSELKLPTASDITIPPLEATGSSGILPGNDESMPTEADVLFGRGGRTNHHPGNKRLRQIVDHYKIAYEMARKAEKPKYAKAIVKALRDHTTPSRFLRMNDTTNQWEDVGDRRAAEKVSQTLREKEKEGRGKTKSSEGPP